MVDSVEVSSQRPPVRDMLAKATRVAPDEIQRQIRRLKIPTPDVFEEQLENNLLLDMNIEGVRQKYDDVMAAVEFAATSNVKQFTELTKLADEPSVYRNYAEGRKNHDQRHELRRQLFMMKQFVRFLAGDQLTDGEFGWADLGKNICLAIITKETFRGNSLDSDEGNQTYTTIKTLLDDTQVARISEPACIS